MASAKDKTIKNFLGNLIEGMRPKLLDLTRRNPLLSTPFSDRSHSNLRVVDEVPSFLFEKLLTEKMRLIPLPSLEEDPKDESSLEFINAFSLARYSDEEYLRELNELDQSQEDSDQQLIDIERELKDRVRAQMGLPKRQTKANLSLQGHAKNHHIDPSYDLSFDLDPEKQKHVDDEIQTLLLPEQFERRLTAISSKVRLWQQETGISVFHVAFGFLEWSESNSKSSFAPLVLMPATLEKERTSSGVKFYISTESENPQENFVLSEKLRLDFAIDLPRFDKKFSLEGYLLDIENSIPKHLGWRLRNQIAIGVFPSARMAMYHDLDTGKWDFSNNKIISSLFFGNENSNVSVPFADDYEVDTPKIAAKIPYLISEADSSQFSTLVDLADEKNLAVEGPPGSGKSQTIVNAIATAIYSGKKVLFVAEKSAALEVVKSRLEALNLGEFILPLLATKNSRATIIKSLRERLSFYGYYDVDNLDNLQKSHGRHSSQIKEYIGILGEYYGATGLTVHEILGQRIKFGEYLKRLPEKLKSFSIPNVNQFTDESIKELMIACDELEEADAEYSKARDNWKVLKAMNLTPYRAEEITSCISNCAKLYTENESARAELNKYGFQESLSGKDVECLVTLIKKFSENYDDDSAKLIEEIDLKGATDWLQQYISAQIESRLLEASLKDLVNHLGNPETQDSIKTLINLAEKFSIHRVTLENINSVLHEHEEHLKEVRYVSTFFSTAVEKVPRLKDKSLGSVAEMCRIATSANRKVLSFRSDLFKDPFFSDYLKKLHKVAHKLKATKTELSGCVNVDQEISVDEIKLHLDAMKSAGLFRIFSSRYRVAKRFYQALSLKTKFLLADAVDNLTALLKFKLEETEFNNEESLQALFKFRFEGINTDFGIALETLDYYSEIEQLFSSSKDNSLRDFLLHESSETIKSLPDFDAEKCVDHYENFEMLASELKGLEETSETLKNDLERMTQSFRSIRASEVSIQQLQSILQDLYQFHDYKKQLGNNHMGKLLDGGYFEKGNFDVEFLKSAIEYYDQLRVLGKNVRRQLIKLFLDNKHLDCAKTLDAVIESDAKCKASITSVASDLGCKVEDIVTTYDSNGIADWASCAKDDKDGLINYSKLVSYKTNVSNFGFGDVVEEFSESEERYRDIRYKIRALILSELAESVYMKYGSQLAKYSGLKLDKIRRSFVKNDQEIQDLSSYHIAETLHQNAQPPMGIGRGPKRDWTEFKLLESETSKKQRYISARDLTKRAGKALLELKPCWMMSPLSVAQYIKKGNIEFDLLIIDEASQMTPENAIGAIARCKQAMVVGDTNQLPPTSFFKKFIAVNDDDDETDAVTEESILEIANNAFRPARRLRWHYRSRHSSLIAFSNKYVYDNDLTIYPSACEDNPNMGVSLINVDGLYSSGSNPREAEKLIEHIVTFMTVNSDRSLGVVTVNQKQRDLIAEEFEHVLSMKPSLLDYINKWEEKDNGLEAFFIKNLENVQGDERDVIFISTVYGPQSPGTRVMQRFGPINGVAGKRRLNVLFTRAKEQIVTFSSMTSADILADENSNPGVYLLKQWLEYSATNVLESGIRTQRDPDSALEEYVIAQLKNMGCEPVPQVGVAGYFVDIGVRHPNWPHGYILGVECDGASYHSSKSARDRDRLREEVLRNLGWEIYRIWSTDWFENPRKEAEKLRNKITLRLQELTGKESEFSRTTEFAEKVGAVVSEKAEDLERDIESVEKPIEEDNTAVTESVAKVLLINLRDNEIKEEFEDALSERGILNEKMIGALIAIKPITPSEFRDRVPLDLREKIDYRQMIYLHTILDIIKRIE